MPPQPSDGYFAARPPPGPSRLGLGVAFGPGDVKSTRDDDQSSVMSSPRSLATRRSMDSPPLTEAEPLLPPPAYDSIAPSQPQSTPYTRQPQRQDYGTHQHAPFFFDAGQPQSMSLEPTSSVSQTPPNDNTEEQGFRYRASGVKRQSWSRRLMKTAMVIFVTFIVICIVWKVALKIGSHSDRDQPPLSRETKSASLRLPSKTQSSLPENTNPTLPDVPRPTNTMPTHPTLPGDAVPKQPAGHVESWPTCPLASYPWAYTFDLFDVNDSLILHEAIQTSLASVTGDIQFVPGPRNQKADFQVAVTVGSTEPSILDLIRIYLDDSSLKMDLANSTDNKANSSRTDNVFGSLLKSIWKLFDTSFPELRRKPCIVVRAVVYVSPTAKLDYLDVRSHHLSVNMASGLSLEVQNQTMISVRSGSVNILEAYTFTSRRVIIDVSSGSIRGDYALLDLLSLQTHSGSIRANVFPKKADLNRPVPAEFRAISSSGSVEVHYPIHELLPDRDYTVYVISTSGSISGEYIHGIQTTMDCASGSITAKVLPYASGRHASTLYTNSKSGRTSLQVLPPIDIFSHDIRLTTARHDSHSGGVDVRYPRGWEGEIAAETNSGHISLDGPDIEEVEHHRYGSGEYLRATKGHDGSSTMALSVASGSLGILFRDL